ncbi:MAG: circadian clock KaiB domain protein [Chthonomonadaceae bacterium]|nr:circadian clock KaiB domain protein [Chthonomonadaceae bacterium]
MDPETYREEANTALTPFERAIAASERPIYMLRLYVTGTTPRSIRAIANLRKICEEHLQGRYDLEVIDLYQQPHLAQGDQIVAAPTLIKKYPFPVRRIIGDMSDTDQVLIGLDLLHRAGNRAL